MLLAVFKSAKRTSRRLCSKVGDSGGKIQKQKIKLQKVFSESGRQTKIQHSNNWKNYNIFNRTWEIKIMLVYV